MKSIVTVFMTILIIFGAFELAFRVQSTPITTPQAVTSTEWKSPTATGRRYSDWGTPENAYSSNDQYAVADTWYESQDWYNFGFNIPSGLNIVGIEIKLEGTGDGIDYVGKVKCRVFLEDVSLDETDYLEFPATEDAFQTVGSPLNLWGFPFWTSENFEDDAAYPFVVRLTTGQDWHTCRLDNLQVKVYYTEEEPNQPPYQPTAVSQYESDGTTTIPEGETTTQSNVVFKATASDPDLDLVRFEIELRQTSEPFMGQPTSETISDYVPSGTQVTITSYNLVNADYKWQYRAGDADGATSDWAEFGATGNMDFRVNTSPGDCGWPVLVAPVKVSSNAGFSVGDTLTARFNISNQGTTAIHLDKLLLGGRFNGGTLPGGGFPDFSYSSVTLQIGQIYRYEGTLDLTEVGFYQFFVAYYIANPTEAEKLLLDSNNWNTCIDLAPGLADNDRTWSVQVTPHVCVNIPSRIKVLKSDGQVEEMMLEEYLKGVVCTEMGPDYVKSKFGLNDEQALEAMKAQAIASRTWAVARVLGIIPNPHRTAGAHVCTTQCCQAWSSDYRSLSNQAVQDTCNAVITFNNRVIQSYFFAHCDGKTRTTLTAYPNPWAKDLLYCRSVECICPEKTMSGHGVGMCQWGAARMAKLGETCTDILKHYFTGVEIRLGTPLDKFNVAKIECPGELRVYDSENRTTGVVQGVIREEILNSTYDEANRAVIIVAPNSTYRYEVCGTEDGVYDLAVTSVTDQETAAFAAANIPMSANATNQFSINWTILSQGGEGVIMAVDDNGDGSFEYTFSSDSELDRAEYVNATSQFDTGIEEVTLQKTVVGQDCSLPINVTIMNYGTYAEVLDVEVYLNATLLASQIVALTNASSLTLNLLWNTTGWLKGNYSLCAYVTPVPGETFTFDNTFIRGTVTVTIPGDVDGNFAVNILDVVKITSLYLYKVPDPGFDPNKDIDGNGVINILDVVICTSHYGQKWP